MDCRGNFNAKIKPLGKGFTIIELLITISIMGMLTVIMIPAMRSFDRKNKVAAGIEGLKSAVTEAKNYSMSPRYADKDVDRYAVRVSSSYYEVGWVNKLGTWNSIYQRNFPKGVVYASGTFSPLAAPVASSIKEIGFMAADSKVLWDGQYSYDSWPLAQRIGLVGICVESNCSAANIKSVSVNSYTGQISIN